MSIRQLKRFIEENEHLKEQVYKKVDLKEIAQHWRDSGKPAVVVTDVSCMVRLFGNDFDFAIGGELKQIVQRVKNFIEAFRAISVELVFFSSASLIEKELYKVGKREIKEAVLKIWDSIEKEPIQKKSILEITSSGPCEKKFWPSLHYMVIRESFSDAGCKTFVHPEARLKGIAKYAVENDCLGIISNDTDVFVYDGIRHVFTTSELDVSSLETVEFRRDPVIDAIGLQRGAESKFAILMGNGCIDYNDNRRYHRSVLEGNKCLYDKVRTLARIANQIHEMAGDDAETAARLLTEKIYGRRAAKQEKWILRSLRVYDTEFTADVTCSTTGPPRWRDTLNYMYKHFLETGMGIPIIHIMKRQIFIRTERLEGDQFCSASYLAELRRRVYSILLYEKNEPQGQKEFVEEISASGCREIDEIYLVGTINVEVEHPGIYQLREGGRELDDTRWKLAAWALSTPDFVLTDRELSPFRREDCLDNSAVVGLTLLYLYNVLVKSTNEENSFRINKRDFTALTVMVASVPAMDATELEERYVEKTTRKAAFLATLYQRFYVDTRLVLSVCGLKINCKLCDSYSGLLFHYLMQQDDPTKFFTENSVPPQAEENYTALKKVQDSSGATFSSPPRRDFSSAPRMEAANFFPSFA